MSNTYVGAIAHIYDGYKQFVLNKGREQGIEEHHKFIIIEFGSDIIDPETGENLGPLEIVKGKVRVLHVQDKITTLESDELLLAPPTEEFIYNTPNNTKSVWGMSINPNVPTSKIVVEGAKKIKPLGSVKIGDKVKLITHW